MTNCKSCHTALEENAKFCHSCGESVLKIEAVLDCPACHTENPMEARFCKACGKAFSNQGVAKNFFDEQPIEEMEQEFADQFFVFLKQTIHEQQNPNKWEAYAERLQNSPFRNAFEVRISQLTQEAIHLKASHPNPAPQVKAQLDLTFLELADYFMIHFCTDLNDNELPPKIMKYHNAQSEQIDKYEMILDYLDLDNEIELSYTNLMNIPFDKLANVSQSFLFPDKKEKIYFITDQSISGKGKHGFAMTDRAIYWKAHLQKPQKVLYSQLFNIMRQQEWITINSHFFNVNPAMNVKMLKLLRRLKNGVRPT